ncbi:MAG: trypsin-like peptidase domain-containing protein [Prevotella sp.]|nr:trypsin-like peptidase domain-containing protein [Prevotella sp.]MBQ9237369.1 trypsin-like peptidase domain-containing protein [Prevotella sp.]MBR1839513.1 trypsin-like peptidase domain-containing protein [Prevotella sp.]
MKQTIMTTLLAVSLSLAATHVYNNTCSAAPVAAAGAVDLTVAAEKALPCVVHIKFLQNSKIQEVEVQNDPFGDMFDPFGFFGQRGQGPNKRKVQTPKKEGTGSGVIISQDGYIVTNNHVVEGADELTITLNDNREFSARIIGTDKNTDLALIKVNATGLPAIKVISSDDIKVGEWVLAIGHPLNLRATVTAGIVSAKARSLGANGVEAFIQTDAAINQGNSGGALVNAKGELIGINAMLTSPTGSNIGYGFAIPTTIMNKVVDDLKQYGSVQRGLIGIQGQDARNYIDAQKEQNKEVDLGTNEGVYVAKVVDDGAAADAGIEEGDVITAVDGQKVTKMAELQEILATKRPGDKVVLTYLHKKSKKTATVTLKNEQGNTKVVKDADLDVLGAVIREVNENEKADLDIKYGLKVTKVNAGKFRERGIPAGFVIQTVNEASMKTLSDLADAVKAANKSKDPVLIIKGLYPSGKREYFTVPLN